MRASGTFPHWPDVPPISPEHLAAAVFHANRSSLLSDLPIRKGGKVAEIGVWQGLFSKVLIAETKPRQFFAFDIFMGHLEEEWNGLSGRELFDGLTHRQFYEKEMAAFKNVLTVVEGRSETTLPAYCDGSFDLVYIDAAHDYASVKADATLATRMLAPSGFLIFNDYELVEPSSLAPVGVVPVVNDLVVNHGWKVVGFALGDYLYCDIALRRDPDPTDLAAVQERQRERRASSGRFQVDDLRRLQQWEHEHQEALARRLQQWEHEHQETLARRLQQWEHEHQETLARRLQQWEHEHQDTLARRLQQWEHEHPDYLAARQGGGVDLGGVASLMVAGLAAGLNGAALLLIRGQLSFAVGLIAAVAPTLVVWTGLARRGDGIGSFVRRSAKFAWLASVVAFAFGCLR